MLLYGLVCINLVVWGANGLAIAKCITRKSWMGLAVSVLFTLLGVNLMFSWSQAIITDPIMLDWAQFTMAWIVSCVSPLVLVYLVTNDMI